MKPRLVLFLIILVLISAGIGAGAFYIFGRNKTPAKPAPPKMTTGHFDVEEMIVNLADVAEPHYVKLSVSIEYETEEKKSAEVAEAVTKSTAKMRDAVIGVITSRTYRELLTREGKESLKKCIAREWDRSVPDTKAKQVYFTTFTMQ